MTFIRQCCVSDSTPLCRNDLLKIEINLSATVLGTTGRIIRAVGVEIRTTRLGGSEAFGDYLLRGHAHRNEYFANRVSTLITKVYVVVIAAQGISMAIDSYHTTFTLAENVSYNCQLSISPGGHIGFIEFEIEHQ